MHTSLRTKEVVEIPSIYNQMPRVTHVDPSYRMNYDQILDKPFLVSTVKWTSINNNFEELWRLPFPSAVMTNPLAKVPFDSSVFFQARMCCMLQVSGTPVHQGLLLVAAVPHGTPKITNANQILSAPHVFLNATESTSVCLECPMYTPSTLYRTQNPEVNANNLNFNTSRFGTDVFDLVFFVMDKLSGAPGASNIVSISVHTIFKEAQFYVPKPGLTAWQAQCLDTVVLRSKEEDNEYNAEAREGNSNFKAEGFVETLWRLPTKILDDVASGLKVVTGDLIDYGRGMIKELTGFHNPNKPEIDTRILSTYRNFPNNVDQPMHLEVLDNHAQFSRIYDDYYFRTKQDEMDLKFLTSKPVYVGKFKVSSSTAAGKNLFAYPMTPMVEGSLTEPQNIYNFYSPLRTIYEASRYWRGDLKLHIQAVCTNFHFCKILILKNYAMTNGIANVASPIVPKYEDIHNLSTDTLEFSAGGQIQTINLKFNSHLRQLECTKDYVLNAVSHGMVYGYLVQPLTFNSNIPLEVTFNVYISGGEDLQFSGYALDPINVIPGAQPTYPGVPSSAGEDAGVYEILEDGTHTGRVLSPETIKMERLRKRKQQFLIEKPSFYVVQDGDQWEDVSYVTGNTIETLRHLNQETHNNESKGYNIFKGPMLKPDENLKIWTSWTQKDLTPLNFQPETMERAEGTNALVNSNDQEEILNKTVPCSEDIKMAFRPNTSIRDYMRIMYPMRTVIEKPIQIKNVVAFDLSKFLTLINGTYFQAIYSLYTGMSGGLKLKFKISGASNASAVFVPPSSYAINATSNSVYPMSNEVPTQAQSLASFFNGTTYNPAQSYTALQIEMQDYTRPYNNTGATVTCKAGNSFILEMAIPNMNPFNFTGNASKWYSLRDVENDLGVVYINYDASFDGTNFGRVEIIPFIGLNDEARLGFQVYAPRKEIPIFVITDGGSNTQCRNSILRPYGGGVVPGSLPGLVLFPPLCENSAYYFNTT